MHWTTLRGFKDQIHRLWERGELLRALNSETPLFPLLLKLKRPHSSDLTYNFAAVRAWVTGIAAIPPQIRVVWGATRHGVQGNQNLPRQVWVDSPDEALALIGKQDEAAQYLQMVEQTRITVPVLLPWLTRRPLQAIALAPHWSRILAVVQWRLEAPNPAIYLRQVDIPGVDTKFIERHLAVLAELFDLALPADSIVTQHTGTRLFAYRYGFLDKPTHIRFRILDEQIALIPNATHPDISLDTASFAGIQLPVTRVFITENEINFLAFPLLRNSIVIFGKGYGWESLSRARWLTACSIYYWGDIDTNGFVILNQLRQVYPHVQSILMDHETLMMHQDHWGEEISQVRHDLPCLTPEERAIYDELRDNRIRRNLRLEQERVKFEWLKVRLFCLS